MDQCAFGVGHGQHAGTQLQRFERRILGHVARAGNGHALVFEVLIDGLEHFQGEVHHAVASGLRTDQAAAKRHALAGEHAAGLVGQLLVHAVQETHLAAAHADVAGGHVGVGADVTVEFHHQGLAEAHHLTIALALGVKVGAALAAAHGQRGEGVLEGLLEGEELQDAQIDGRVEAQAALVGADGGAVLHAPGAVDLDLTLVVHPGHTELDGALGFDQALEQALAGIAGVGLQERPEAVHHLLYGLQKFGLVRIAPLDHVHEVVNGLVLHTCCLPGIEHNRLCRCGPGWNGRVPRRLALRRTCFRPFVRASTNAFIHINTKVTMCQDRASGFYRRAGGQVTALKPGSVGAGERDGGGRPGQAGWPPGLVHAAGEDGAGACSRGLSACRRDVVTVLRRQG